MLNDETIQAIRDEIGNDPASRGYSGKTAMEILVLMNEPISQSPQVFEQVEVAPAQIAKILLTRGKWIGVVDATSLAARRLVAAAGLADVTVDWALAQATITTLISEGVLATEDGQALQDVLRTEVLKSRTQVLGHRYFLEEDIKRALAL